MCGIICFVSHTSGDCEDKKQNLYTLFKKHICNRGPDFSSSCYLENSGHSFLFGASVLWLQGVDITPQPVVTEESVLLFNGDIFNSDSCFKSKEVSGDTKVFLQVLENSVETIEVLHCLHGPYAFVYLNKIKSKLYFGRDIFGRRSLLFGKHEGEWILTSVATKSTEFKFIEVPACGVFSLDLLTDTLQVFPWDGNQGLNIKLAEFENFIERNVQVIKSAFLIGENKIFQPCENDLAMFKQLKDLPVNEAFTILLQDKRWLRNILELKNLLEKSVKVRVETQPKYCQTCISTRNQNCNDTLTSILFSGGVDCAIIALLVDQFTEKNRPIDLLNVAFDRSKDFKTPDRVTGLETFEELKTICPNRQWNFLEVNVTSEELNLEREHHIANLIYPLNTILDDSLGCALWFAARGQIEGYKSPSRIVFSGIGADELFGGYTRHRATLKREGWEGLHDTLTAEWQNIPYRNLGRDDRVVSDSGRQLRLPYLDESVVSFVRNLNCWERTCPSSDLAQGFGEKILIRSLAYYLGLTKAATFKKRALQFGSRIANPKENAHDVSYRL